MNTRANACVGAIMLLTAAACDDSGSSVLGPVEAGGGNVVDASARDTNPRPDTVGADASLADAAADAAEELRRDSASANDGSDATTVDALTGPQTVRFGAASGKLPQNSCPAWELLDDAVPEDPRIENGHYVIETSDDPERIFYTQQSPLVLTPATLVIEARVKLLSNVSSTAARSAALFGFTIGTKHWKNVLALEAGKVFLLTSENQRGPEAATDTIDAFHTYRLTVDTTSGAVSVSRDGAPLLTGASFTDPDTTVNRVFFGEGTLLAHGASQWEYVEHNAANTAACPTGL